MAVWDWFKEGSRHVKDGITTNDTLKKWHTDLDRWFDNTMQELSNFHLTGEKSKIDFYPRIDISETKQQYNLTIEVPGVHPKEIHLEIENHTVTVHGEKRYALLYQIRMFSANRFQRRLASLDEADFKRVKEKLEALLEL